MQATNQDFPFYGTVSHGTMRKEDLIPAFVETLHALDTNEEHTDLIAEACDLDHDYDSEQADYILDDLFDALDALAPDGYYFGAHPGDGADYGFWPVDCDE